MLRVLIFHLERNNINENFGFNIHLPKDSSKNTGAPEINEIKTGSHAGNAGLQVGDRVIAVDDQNVTTAKEVYEIFREKLKAKIMVERMTTATNVQKKVSIQQKTTTQIHNSAVRIENRPSNSIPQTSTEAVTRRQSAGSSNDALQTQPSVNRPNALTVASTSKVVSDPWSFNNKINSSSSGYNSRLQKQSTSLPSNQSNDTFNSNKKSKKTLAAVLGQPEVDNKTLFAHHHKKKSSYDDDDDDDDGPSYTYKSILDVCPAEGMLLSLAGRPSYSEDFRGD